ncbi:MAG: EamA family transporter, partial [Gemmataceae bacterium]|nr:EamA family transporter [Gemmataceae bacterium]MDW8267308.1 EamA family transporter [Gemmataceae bacterium]
MDEPTAPRTPAWALALAFALVYIAWGTTYLAIKVGVQSFPPLLFGGVRILLAGLVLAAYLAWRGQPLTAAGRELLGTAACSWLMFLGGNGLITLGQRSVDSGVAAILVATTPLCTALIEALYPWGDRLSVRGWFGLCVGLGGVVVLWAPQLGQPQQLLVNAGPWLILGSTLCWSAGSVLFRYLPRRLPHLSAAALQMVIGGGTMTLLGLLLGEGEEVSWADFTLPTVYAFFHLLIVGSLIGFVAYSWLLGRVSATLAGTYAYVNPVVALLVGWLLGGETITGWMIAGMVVILAGVTLVRQRGGRADRAAPPATAAA